MGSVKHLNPRQGITTTRIRKRLRVPVRDRCETPKSPPGDYNPAGGGDETGAARAPRVKHLNPRQGITTRDNKALCRSTTDTGVKHLNPRQGITT